MYVCVYIYIYVIIWYSIILYIHDLPLPAPVPMNIHCESDSPLENAADKRQLVGKCPWKSIGTCHWKFTMISKVSISDVRYFASWSSTPRPHAYDRFSTQASGSVHRESGRSSIQQVVPRGLIHYADMLLFDIETLESLVRALNSRKKCPQKCTNIFNTQTYYGQFSEFHVCFCGLDSGNLKFETVRTNKQHICC